MFCIKCQNIVNEDHIRTLENHNIPEEFCSSCYIQLILAEGNCNKCHSITRHRVSNDDTIILQRMAMTSGKYIPRKPCSCGGMISLTRIANKNFITELHQVRNEIIQKTLNNIVR